MDSSSGSVAPQGPFAVAIDDFDYVAAAPCSPARFVGFDEIERALDRRDQIRLRLPALQHRTDRARPGHARAVADHARGCGLYLRQLDVSVEERQLVIRGRQLDDKVREYIHRGIAARQF